MSNYWECDTGVDCDECGYYGGCNTQLESKRVPMTHRWYNTSEKLPEDDREVVGMDSGGNERKLTYWKRMWWHRDKSMYVYYTPQKWRYA
jgi:hypothetical protein